MPWTAPARLELSGPRRHALWRALRGYWPGYLHGELEAFDDRLRGELTAVGPEVKMSKDVVKPRILRQRVARDVPATHRGSAGGAQAPRRALV